MEAFWGELVGTAILLFLGCSVCAGTSLKKSFGNNAGWLAIQFGWGMSVMIAIFAVGKFSGAHFNPVVTITFALIGEFPWSEVPGYLLAQLLGAMLGAAAAYLQYLPHWKETEDPNVKLTVFVTKPAIPHTFANILSEMLAAFILILALLTIGANRFSEGLHPLIIGFLILTLGLSLGGSTGAAMNPARDIGPRIIHFLLPIPGKRDSNWGYAWIPIVGPIMGGSIGGFFYQAVFLGEMIPQLFFSLGLGLVVLAVSYLADLNRHKKSDSIGRLQHKTIFGQLVYNEKIRKS
ncbi:MIP/aquaporin family protein [Neobacillus pocheonensis]|uniref:MIP/aquaporin family protein n=1 Tax=Neobacillus pocheonensis TaxID=363869 RepID=UPI003D273A11